MMLNKYIYNIRNQSCHAFWWICVCHQW